MSSGIVTKEWYLSKIGTHENLKQKETKLRDLHDDEVLVKIHAVSLQYRDLIIATGDYPLGTPPPDLVPCSDMAGEVIEVGSRVAHWKKGDRVCANFSLDHLDGDPTPATMATALGGAIHGVLTEYKAFPSYSLVKVPDHLSYEEASTLPCAALTAYNALTSGPNPLKGGDFVVVQGTGGVSMHALQIAVASGATVIATSSSNDKLKIAEKLGAQYLINYKENPNWDEEVLKITGGRGADHIIEVGGPGTLEKSMKSIRFGGNIGIIGFLASGEGAINVISYAISRSIYLHGILIGSIAQFNNMNRLFAANPEKTRPLIDKVFPFDQAVEAYAYLKSQKHVGKVVIKVASQ